jgi:hypothetical protein
MSGTTFAVFLPYDLAKTRNSAIKQLIYMASPTGDAGQVSKSAVFLEFFRRVSNGFVPRGCTHLQRCGRSRLMEADPLSSSRTEDVTARGACILSSGKASNGGATVARLGDVPQPRGRLLSNFQAHGGSSVWPHITPHEVAPGKCRAP